MANLITLHESLVAGTYRHAPYAAFVVNDPKRRSIHKACVADRVLHRAIYRKLYPFFDRIFIADSFSCRNEKGTHKALDRFMVMARKASKNYRQTAWVLKCDIRQFFASIDHGVLLRMLDERIVDKRLMALLGNIVESFCSGTPGTGLPLGNLTSQLLANVYMNALDQFVKHSLRVKYYVRYADDFVLMSDDKYVLREQLYLLNDFLITRLKLCLHPAKVSLQTVASGVDFLGWVHFPRHHVLRTSTKRRMFAKLASGGTEASIASYLGLLGHGNAHGLAMKVEELQRSSHST